jgi:co-chaperonin GroES (HSP10)
MLMMTEATISITPEGVSAEATAITVAETALEKQRREKIAQETKEQAELEKLIPKPTGYHVLIALPNIEETFGESQIVKSNQTVRDEYILSTIGLVLDMGEQAYNDKDRFPTGPWCKQGDYVMFRANTGTRFKIGRQEYRLMNDDSIQAVVPDHKVVSRA